MLTITSSFNIANHEINTGKIYLDHDHLSKPITIYKPKDDNYISSSYKLSKNKSGEVMAYTTKLPPFNTECDFIHAHAVGSIYPIEQYTNSQTGEYYYKTSLNLFNKFYVKLLFFNHSANLISGLIKEDPSRISSIEVMGRFQSQVYNERVSYSIFVNDFNVVGWREQKEESKQDVPF